MSGIGDDYWGESVYAEVEREARDTWRAECPDPEMPSQSELSDEGL